MRFLIGDVNLDPAFVSDMDISAAPALLVVRGPDPVELQ